MAEFKLSDYPLNYLFGNKALFSKKFKLNCHFANPCILEVDDKKALKASNFPELQKADGFYFSSIPISQTVPILETKDGFIRYILKKHSQDYIDLSTSFEDYLTKFSSKSRSTIKRKIRKFANASGGEVDWKIYETRKEVAEFYKLARQVSVHTYQEAIGMGLSTDEDFVDNMLMEAEKGNIRGYLLFFEGKPVSYLYCPIANKTIDYERLGYLPEAAKHSAGTVLFTLALEDIFEIESVDYFDLKEGQSSHKTLFSTNVLVCANILFLQDTMANQLWIRMHKCLRDTTEASIRILEKLGLKEKIKKLFK